MLLELLYYNTFFLSGSADHVFGDNKNNVKGQYVYK
jgi:hypothetical protein